MRCICVRSRSRPSIYLCICHKLFSYTAINACTLLNHFWPKNLFFLHNYFLEERTTHITLRFIVFLLGFCACVCVLVGAKSVWMLYKNRWALSMFVQFINKIKVVSLRVLWCRCLKGNVRYGITGWWPTKPGITMLFVSPRMANIDTNSVCFSFHSHCWSKQRCRCRRCCCRYSTVDCKVLKNQCDIDCHFVIDMAIGGLSAARECYANFKNGNMRFRFCISNDHIETKTTNLCLIPNKFKLAQIFFLSLISQMMCTLNSGHQNVPYVYRSLLCHMIWIWKQKLCNCFEFNYFKRLENGLLLGQHSIYEVKIFCEFNRSLRLGNNRDNKSNMMVIKTVHLKIHLQSINATEGYPCTTIDTTWNGDVIFSFNGCKSVCALFHPQKSQKKSHLKCWKCFFYRFLHKITAKMGSQRKCDRPLDFIVDRRTRHVCPEHFYCFNLIFRCNFFSNKMVAMRDHNIVQRSSKNSNGKMWKNCTM